MDAETAVSAAVGVGAGGGVAVWFAKVMVERLVRQLDALADVVGRLKETSAASGERLGAVEARVDRISGEVQRADARVDAVSARVEGLSSSYGPRLQALEAARRRKP